MYAQNDNVPTASQIRFRVDPRMVAAPKAARLLGLTPAEFAMKRPALFDIGMPKPCPVTGFYDIKAINIWLDRSAGLSAAPAVREADPHEGFEERLARLG
ncbi:MAG: hypothetical protein JWQ22_1756 [Devosia sp.]|nr:hypothetical protein [Devosia sp.]